MNIVTFAEGVKNKANEANSRRMQAERARSLARMRIGKTAKDRAPLAVSQAQRNRDNKLAREAWQKDGAKKGAKFPLHTCNGKRSRALKGE